MFKEINNNKNQTSDKKENKKKAILVEYTKNLYTQPIIMNYITSLKTAGIVFSLYTMDVLLQTAIYYKIAPYDISVFIVWLIYSFGLKPALLNGKLTGYVKESYSFLYKGFLMINSFLIYSSITRVIMNGFIIVFNMIWRFLLGSEFLSGYNIYRFISVYIFNINILAYLIVAIYSVIFFKLLFFSTKEKTIEEYSSEFFIPNEIPIAVYKNPNKLFKTMIITNKKMSLPVQVVYKITPEESRQRYEQFKKAHQKIYNTEKEEQLVKKVTSEPMSEFIKKLKVKPLTDIENKEVKKSETIIKEKPIKEKEIKEPVTTLSGGIKRRRRDI